LIEWIEMGSTAGEWWWVGGGVVFVVGGCCHWINDRMLERKMIEKQCDANTGDRG
jgi:hypothetical protein